MEVLDLQVRQDLGGGVVHLVGRGDLVGVGLAADVDAVAPGAQADLAQDDLELAPGARLLREVPEVVDGDVVGLQGLDEDPQVVELLGVHRGGVEVGGVLGALGVDRAHLGEHGVDHHLVDVGGLVEVVGEPHAVGRVVPGGDPGDRAEPRQHATQRGDLALGQVRGGDGIEVEHVRCPFFARKEPSAQSLLPLPEDRSPLTEVFRLPGRLIPTPPSTRAKVTTKVIQIARRSLG